MYALGSRFHIAFLFGSIHFRRQHTRMGALIVGVVLEIYVPFSLARLILCGKKHQLGLHFGARSSYPGGVERFARKAADLIGK